MNAKARVALLVCDDATTMVGSGVAARRRRRATGEMTLRRATFSHRLADDRSSPPASRSRPLHDFFGNRTTSAF
jgi:hypothetical protein